MRCPTCGTENTPDSRFCGGCGAKLFPTDPAARVAPTARIPDDAPFPPPSIPPGQYAAAQPAQYASSGPASIPPPAYTPPPASVPPRLATPLPGSMRVPAAPSVSRANTAPPARSLAEPSMSFPVPARSRWGLIALVLVLDVGLATAGAILLGKGLAKPARAEAPARSDPPPPNGSAHADVPAGSGSAVAQVGVTDVAGSNKALADVIEHVEAGSGSSAGAGSGSATITPATKHDPKKKLDKKSTGTTTTNRPDPTPIGGGGSTPPADVVKALSSEIELQASRAQGAFDQCYLDAAAQQPIHGEVHIAFQVLPDGRVANVAAVRNDPNSGQLAGCLTNIILRWSFAAHPATASGFVRPFLYP